MAAPEELVASPLTLYTAVVGTAFPKIDDAVSAFDPAWKVLGTAGADNYADGGVSVSHSEQVVDITPAGSTMPTKRYRTGESLLIKVGLMDVSPTAYALVMNNATITTVAAAAGVAGESSFDLFRGDQVNSYAILARGLSSVDNTLNLQYEFSKAFVSVNGDIVWDKGKVATLPVEILVVRHLTTDKMTVRIQTAVAS